MYWVLSPTTHAFGQTWNRSEKASPSQRGFEELVTVWKGTGRLPLSQGNVSGEESRRNLPHPLHNCPNCKPSPRLAIKMHIMGKSSSVRTNRCFGAAETAPPEKNCSVRGSASPHSCRARSGRFSSQRDWGDPAMNWLMPTGRCNLLVFSHFELRLHL